MWNYFKQNWLVLAEWFNDVCSGVWVFVGWGCVWGLGVFVCADKLNNTWAAYCLIAVEY